MQKNFKNELIQAAKVVALGLVLGLTIGFVHADWSAPVNNAAPPTCASGNPGCDAPIDTSSHPQIKGDGPNNKYVYFTRSANESLGVAGNVNFGLGNFVMGGPTVNNSNELAQFNVPMTLSSYQYGSPLTIDLSQNQATTGAYGNASRDALMIKGGGDDHVNILTDKPLLNFFDTNTTGTDGTGDTSIGAHNGYFSGTLTVSGGSPSEGAVLTSDSTGNASWQQPTKYSDLSAIKIVRSNGDRTGANAYCPSGYTLIGGGGHCNGTYDSTDRGPISSSEPGPGSGDSSQGTTYSYSDASYNGGAGFNYWHVDCAGNNNLQSNAYAICAPDAGYQAPPTVTFVQASGSGADGQSCAAWLNTSVSNTEAMLIGTGTNYPGKCVYKSTSNGACTIYSADYAITGQVPVGSCTYTHYNSSVHQNVTESYATYSGH